MLFQFPDGGLAVVQTQIVFDLCDGKADFPQITDQRQPVDLVESVAPVVIVGIPVLRTEDFFFVIILKCLLIQIK